MKSIVICTVIAAAVFTTRGVQAAEEHQHEHTAAHAEEAVSVTGEVVDMACYIDHGARGEKHAACAKTCIESGLPVGIKSSDGKVYLIIGEHKPLNKAHAEHAAKTITVKGKLVERDGFRMISNAEIVK